MSTSYRVNPSRNASTTAIVIGNKVFRRVGRRPRETQEDRIWRQELASYTLWSLGQLQYAYGRELNSSRRPTLQAIKAFDEASIPIEEALDILVKAGVTKRSHDFDYEKPGRYEGR